MDKSKIAKELGSLGGKMTAEKHGKKHFSKAGKLGMARRWATIIDGAYYCKKHKVKNCSECFEQS